MIILSLLLGCILDLCLGEPTRHHPLVKFGRYATAVESRLHSKSHALLRGTVAWIIVVIPLVAVTTLVQWTLIGYWFYIVIAGIVLYGCIGWRSLVEHGLRVARPLEQGDSAAARSALGMIVSRDVSALDETGIANAATESMLENGPDAIFAALFWFTLLGIPGVILYRAANTLDAMWGYKNERYLLFGRCAARIDDILNWIPARLTVIAYMIACGDRRLASIAWACARSQGKRWKSPNAGPVMASGAGALGLELGGVGIYHGVRQDRGVLGAGRKPMATDIMRSIRLVNRAGWLWLAGLIVISCVLHFL